MKRHVKSEFRNELAPRSFVSWAFGHSMKNRELATKIISIFHKTFCFDQRVDSWGNVVREG